MDNKQEGHHSLWNWFGLSYSTWLTLPRVLMHEMPDEWQGKMAALLEEWDETWNGRDMPNPYVSAKQGGKFVRWPQWLLNYKYPDADEIEKLRREPE